MFIFAPSNFLKRGVLSPSFINIQMILKSYIQEKLLPFLDDRRLFIIDMHISPQNQIDITIDGDSYVSIDDCVEVSRYVESFLDRDKEDFSLQVSSPDAAKPLILPRQYYKHIGKEFLIRNIDDKEVAGVLEKADIEKIVLAYQIKEKNGKKKVIINKVEEIPFQQIKSAKIKLKF